MYPFFALISRMKYIDRWQLMRNSRPENLSDHSIDVAVIAHALSIIANNRFGHSINCEKAALIGLYHDASEIVTGDMPTPVKYYGDEIRDAYKNVEKTAVEKLLSKLPDDLREEYENIFKPGRDEEDIYMRHLVKCADKISAYIKCIEEENEGNSEFRTAKASTRNVLNSMADQYPEVRVFMEEFLPAYGKTLDELLGR